MKAIVTSIMAIALLLGSCQAKSEPIEVTAGELHASNDKLTEVMVHDNVSPPVASRVYAYPNIAAYEIMSLHNEAYRSLRGQVSDLEGIPEPAPDQQVNYRLAALIAHMDLGRRLIFSEDRITVFRDSLYGVWEEQNPDEFETAKEYGLEVAEFIAGWMAGDNYNQTRTMSKFTVDTEDPSRWQPTPPSYMEGIEPHWNKIRPFVIDSANQFIPQPAPPRGRAGRGGGLKIKKGGCDI